jgi:hypothetical protein
VNLVPSNLEGVPLPVNLDPKQGRGDLELCGFEQLIDPLRACLRLSGTLRPEQQIDGERWRA